jgi:hypothetical protein
LRNSPVSFDEFYEALLIAKFRLTTTLPLPCPTFQKLAIAIIFPAAHRNVTPPKIHFPCLKSTFETLLHFFQTILVIHKNQP